NSGVVDECEGVDVMSRHVEFVGHFLRDRSGRIGHGHEPRFGDAAGEIARVHAAQPAEPHQSDSEPRFPGGYRHFTWSLVTSSSLTLMSGGTVSPRITLTALSTAARLISAGNC